jgi:hypothetical protein
VKRRLLLSVFAMLPATPTLAQSAPPDLAPKLTGGPLNGQTYKDPNEKPRLKEPPRPPAVPDTLQPSAATPSATAAPAR